MSIPGGIRVKLTVALVGIVGGALFAAYLIVVPSLERRLVDAKLAQLQTNANTIANALATSGVLADPSRLDTLVRGFGDAFGARVVVYRVLSSPLALSVVSDSAETVSLGTEQDPVAIETARSGRTGRSRVRRGNEEHAEVAVQLLPTNGILLVSSSLEDQLATVRLVERRMFYATAVGLAIALILGFAAASVHARRIRKLQRAAGRIAQGHFDEPIVDPGDDELGQLAAAFDHMRLQVAQLDSARKEFVANASHELRTPLFSLSGFLELMADEDLDEETRREFLITTRGQVDRLTKLATDLLDLSRMDAGRMRIESEEVDLGDVARVLSEEVHALAESTGHAVEVVADEQAWVQADEERVLQIGRALVRNALTHTPSGTHVALRVERHGSRASFVVEDDGPGIPGEQAERVFQRFHRIEGRQASGSGLGLAISRELAERMGGSVVLQTRPGRTAFVLELPAVSLAALV
jgi:signal transduction histidine kinase